MSTNTLHEIIEWRGAGYYASAQEGSYDAVHIHTYLVDENKDALPNGVNQAAYRMGLGTPAWLEAPPDGAQVYDHTTE